MITTRKKHKIRRITPREFYGRELRELRRIYKKTQEQPLTLVQMRALGNPLGDEQ